MPRVVFSFPWSGVAETAHIIIDSGVDDISGPHGRPSPRLKNGRSKDAAAEWTCNGPSHAACMDNSMRSCPGQR
jgi:hypothetical protein